MSKFLGIKNFLLSQGYSALKLQLNTTNHFIVPVCVNGRRALFILDTGAGATCIDKNRIVRFGLKKKSITHKVAGLGGSGLKSFRTIAKKFEIDGHEIRMQKLLAVDLSHVNAGLNKRKAKPVDGVLGANILLSHSGIIDYRNKVLYLKHKKV